MSKIIRKWKVSVTPHIQLPLSNDPHAIAQRKWAKENGAEYLRKYQNEWQKNKNKEARAKVLEMLGGKCAQCGYTGLALQIDHINGGGTRERREFTNSYIYYTRIIERLQSGSKDYQCLCANCNWIKRMKNKEGSFE